MSGYGKTFDEMALAIMLSPGTEQERAAKLDALLKRANRHLQVAVDCGLGIEEPPPEEES